MQRRRIVTSASALILVGPIGACSHQSRLIEGKLDPSEDRAERTCALLVEWRAALGLPPLPKLADKPKG